MLEVFSLMKKVWNPRLSLANSICFFAISSYSRSPELSNTLFAGVLFDNLTVSIFFKIQGRSDANSGPFFISIEFSSSNLVESHWTKPGSNRRSKRVRSMFFSRSLTILSVKKADIVMGALRISILCFVIGFMTSLIIG